jgi:hypothetical protein
MAGVYHMVGTVMLCGLANHLINYWLLEGRKKEQTRVLFFITLTSIGPQWLTQKQTPLLVVPLPPRYFVTWSLVLNNQ